MSATPRTDAIEERNGNVLCGSANLEFARTLERELAATERLRFGADADRRRLRAEVEKWQGVAATMSSEREHNANEAGRLRAELAVAKNWVEHHSKHADDLIGENVKLRADLERFTGHGLLDCHAICDQRDAAIARAERAEAELAAERERVCVLREALRAIVRQSVEDYDERDPFCGVSLTALAALAATKEDSP